MKGGTLFPKIARFGQIKYFYKYNFAIMRRRFGEYFTPIPQRLG